MVFRFPASESARTAPRSQVVSDTSQDVDAFDKLNKVHRDLSHAALKAMVSVTDGLVLRAVGEGQDSVQPAVKSRLFYRIYDHLIKMLEKSQGLEVSSIQLSNRSDALS